MTEMHIQYIHTLALPFPLHVECSLASVPTISDFILYFVTNTKVWNVF